MRTKLKETVTRLIQQISNIRIAIMAHGDYCDYTKYVVKYQDFTNDVDTLVKFVKDVGSTGGGDSPEVDKYKMKWNLNFLTLSLTNPLFYPNLIHVTNVREIPK